MALVYALIDSSNPTEMRYIGKTCDATPEGRRTSHINEAKKSLEQTYKLRWIRKVLKANGTIAVTIVEDNLTEEESFQRETYYIDYYKSLGHRLTNATSGGEGISGYKHTEEAKEKIQATSTGRVHSEETKAYLRAVNIGKKYSEEVKAKQSAVKKGKKTSEETKAKQRAAQTGKIVSEETRAKLSTAGTGRVTSEETKAKQRASWTPERKANAPKPSEETKAKRSATMALKKLQAIDK